MKQRKENMFGSFQDAVRFLREDLPLPLPFIVKRCIMKNAGDCEKLNGKFIIRINKNLSNDAAILILFHEII